MAASALTPPRDLYDARDSTEVSEQPTRRPSVTYSLPSLDRHFSDVWSPARPSVTLLMSPYSDVQGNEGLDVSTDTLPLFPYVNSRKVPSVSIKLQRYGRLSHSTLLVVILKVSILW